MQSSILRRVAKLCQLAIMFGACSMLASCGGSSVEQRKIEPLAGVQAADADLVKQYLKKAEIPGEVVIIEDEKDFWRVEVAPPPPEPGKKGNKFQQLAGNKAYRVDKGTGKVTFEGNVGG